MSNVRRFNAKYWSTCAGCGEPIQPGDDAGFITGVDGAHCEGCVDEEETAYLEHDGGGQP